MGKQKIANYNLGKIATASFKIEKDSSTITQEREKNIITKITISANYKLLDLIRSYAHSHGMSQGEAVLSALSTFFREYPPPPRPEGVVERERMKMSLDRRRRA